MNVEKTCLISRAPGLNRKTEARWGQIAMRLRLVMTILTMMVFTQAVYAYSPFGGSGLRRRNVTPIDVPGKVTRRATVVHRSPGSLPYPFVRTAGSGTAVLVSTGNPYVARRVKYVDPHRISGGLYSVKSNGIELKLWKAPSGYYYPWVHGQAFYPYNPSVVSINHGAAACAEPPLRVIINDMNLFLADAHDQGRLTREEYLHLSGRLKDLKGMWKSLRLRSGGMVDLKDEASIRRRLMQLSEEIAVRLDA